MRTDTIAADNKKLAYEIREIVSVATQIEATGLDIQWENIGDPVAKGQEIPAWIKAYVREAAEEDSSYAYSPTKGLLATREFIAGRQNETGGAKLYPDNILFFNGLGDAITNLYSHLHKKVRVIGPDPSYPTHASQEAAHANAGPIMYRLDPEDGWQIDLADLESKLQDNPKITGILLVNPGNPTGGVFTRKTLEGVVDLAKTYDCFIVADAIYAELRFSDAPEIQITDVLADVPAIVMRGMSKEVPWPGSRCGWMEFYNTDSHLAFAEFRKDLVDTKMQEVCSTTLPQQVLPKIFSDQRWGEYLNRRNEGYERRAEMAAAELSDIDGVEPVRPDGAYYMSIIFASDVFTDTQTLPAANPQAEAVIEPLLSEAALDKRFVYFLLAAEGICVVPLSSGFHSRYQGIRITLLESDIDTFQDTIARIKKALQSYLSS